MLFGLAGDAVAGVGEFALLGAEAGASGLGAGLDTGGVGAGVDGGVGAASGAGEAGACGTSFGSDGFMSFSLIIELLLYAW